MSKVLRNYLYLDVDLTRSFYAQAEGGIVENIIRKQQVDESHEQKESSRFSPRGLEEKLLWGVGEEKTYVLDDYLFTELEKLLQNTIAKVDANNINALSPGNIISITGMAEIDDGERLLKIARNFNTLYKYIALAPLTDAIETQKLALKKEIDTATGNRKKQLQIDLNNLSKEGLFRQLGDAIHPLTIEALEQVLTLLYPDIFEIKIVAPFDTTCVFRAIINKTHLREESSRLYAKYSSRTQVSWTLIGQVATIYEAESLGEEDKELTKKVERILKVDDDTIDTEASSGVTPSEVSSDTIPSESETKQTSIGLRDAIEAIYDSMTGLEKHLIISGARKTWAITPLAIYQEIPINSQ